MSSRAGYAKALLCAFFAVTLFVSYNALASGLPPSSSITQPANGSAMPAALGSYSIKGSAVDRSGAGLKKVEVSFDGGGTWRQASDTTGTGSLTNWAYRWSPLPLGSYSILSKATDKTDVPESPAPGTHVVVDGSAPASAITSPAPGAYVKGSSIAITGTANDTGGAGLARVEVSTDGGATWTAASGTTSWSYTWTLPGDGSYTIKSRAVDNATNAETPGAGRTVTVDKTPPSSSISDPLGGVIRPSALGTYSVKGAASDGTGSGVSRVDVSTDGGATWHIASGTASWGYTWTPPADGIYSLKSRATDVATNVETPGSGVTVEVDGTPPTGSVGINGGTSYTSSIDVSLTLSATDTGPGRACPGTYPIMCNVAWMQMSADGTTWNAWEAAVTSKAWTLPTGDGLKRVYARFKDAAGNVSAAYSASITLDTSPPSASITSPAAGSYITSAGFTITGNANDTGGSGVNRVEVSTDGGSTWSPATGTSSWSYAWTTPSDGPCTLKARAVDDAGNASDPGAGTAVTVDKTSPTSTVVSPASGASVGGGTTITVTGTAADPGGSGVSRVDVSTDDGSTWAQATGTTSWSYTWTLPADGHYTVRSRATDLASNVESPAPGVSVTVDNTPPTASVASPAAGAIIGGASCTVSGTASDGAGSGISRVEVSTDGGGTWAQASGTTSWSYSWTTPPDGPYTLKARAVDNAGNASGPGAGTAVTVDKTPPTSVVTYPAAGTVINTQSVTITGSAGDGAGSGVSKVEVSTDGGTNWAQASGTASWSYTWATPPDGPCTIKTRATDLAGHLETPGAGVGVTVDRTPPASTVTSPAAGSALKGTSTTITGTASDGTGSGVSKVEVSTDGGSTWAQATGTASWSYAWTLPADGHYTIRCRATDLATNVETPGAGVAVVVDKVPPVSSISSPVPGAFISGATYTVTGVANDGGGSGVSGVEVSTDGGTSWTAAAGTTSWSYTWTTPVTGSYTIKTRAADLAANVETPGAGVSVIVDKDPPASVVTSPAPGALIGAATICTITGTAADTGGSGLDRVEISTDGGATWSAVSGAAAWSYAWTLPADGSYTINTRSYDRAGNTETPGAGVSVTVDNTPPTGSIAPRNGKYTKSKKVWFTLSARDAGSNCPQPDPVMCNVSWMQFSTDGTTWTAWETASIQKQWDFGNITDGVKVLDVRYKDPAGNVSIVYSNSVTYDTTPPSSQVTSPANGSYVGGGTTYNITGTATDAVAGVKLVEVSTDGGTTWAPAADTSGGNWTSWSYAWTLPAEAGYTIKSRATDNADNVETPSAGITVTVDKTPPGSGSVKINADAAYTASASVSLALSATDVRSGVAMMRISNDGVFDTEPWEVYATTKAWTLTGGDGAKTVYVLFKDAAGNITAAYTDAITLDQTPPGGSVTVNGGAASVNTQSVSLGITATDSGSGPAQMQVSNDGVFDTEPWEAYATTKAWTLTGGDGAKTVYAKFKDGAGNVSVAVSGTITLDITPPVGTISINGGAAFTNSTSVSLGLTATETGSGLTQMQVSGDGVFDTEPWEAYAADRAWTVSPGDGAKTVYARFKDGAGNVSVEASGTITLDITPPAGTISINGGAAFTNSTSVSLALSATDAGAGPAQMQVSGDGVFDAEPWETYASTRTWDVTAGDGQKTVYIRFRDAAGNISAASSAAVTLDSAAPSGSVTINNGSTQATTASVSLAISATDAGSGLTQMQVSNDGVFDPEAWEAYATAKDWTLSSGDGTKTVYVRFRDAAGNVSGAYSDDIALVTDTAAPAVSITAPASGAVLTASSCAVTGTADDGAGTGVKTVEVSTDGGATWSPATVTDQSWSYAWNIPMAGTYGILCRAADNIGNTSVPVSTTVTAKSAVTADRASVVLNYNLARPAATTKVKLASQPLSLTGSVSSTKPWLGVSAQSGSTPSGVLITVNPAGLIPRNYTGTVAFSSAYATNGTVAIPVSLTVSPASASAPEQTHFNWNSVITGGNCNFCHQTSGKFLPAGTDARTSPSLCRSCHNTASVAHDRGAGGSAHAIFVCASSGGGKWPTYGNITAALNNNQPFRKLKSGRLVTCTTCHNPMGKKEDYGRKWELTSTADRYAYYLPNGGWSNYGSMTPMVYRTTNTMAEPSYTSAKKTYLVSPAEYTFDEEAGSVTFKAQQATTTCIYVTLDYQYLRASSQDNRLCLDCHTQATHKGANCLACHQAHGSGNLADIRGKLRTTNLTSISVKFVRYTGADSFADKDGKRDGICEVCHTKTKYYRRDGTGFANHSGGTNYDGKDCTACHRHNSGFSRRM